MRAAVSSTRNCTQFLAINVEFEIFIFKKSWMLISGPAKLYGMTVCNLKKRKLRFLHGSFLND